MAYPPYAYKANEPSTLETQLSLLATKPETAGAAMQLLPGATANREAASDEYNRKVMIDQLMQQEAAREAAQHNRATETTTALALKEPGRLALAATAPGTRGLFTPDQYAAIDAGTERDVRAQEAGTQSTLAESYLRGAQSGFNFLPQTAQAQLGVPINKTDPLTMQIERMKEQHSDARAAARNAVDASVLKLPNIGYNTDTHTITLGNLRPETMFSNIAAADAANARLRTPVYDQATGKVIDPDPSTLPGFVGTTTQRKTNQPTGTVQLGGRSAAGDAGKSLPRAKPDAGGGQPNTSAQPGADGGGQLTHSAAPPGGDATLTQLVTKVGGPVGAKLQQMKDNGSLGFAKDAQNRYWIVGPGLKPIGPLPPN